MYLSSFSWHPFPKLAGPLLKDQTNPSEFLSSLGQAQTALCAGCWQHSAVCFRQSPKGVETQGKWKLPPTWCSEMEFFSLFPNFETVRDRGCSLDGTPPGWMIYSSGGFGVHIILQEFVVEGSSDTRSPGPLCPHRPLNPHPEVNSDSPLALHSHPSRVLGCQSDSIWAAGNN